MIVGTVTDLQARVEVVLRFSDQGERSIEYVVDTGFEGQLALPPATVASLGLTPGGQTRVKLADDSHASLPVFSAAILWDDEEVDVSVMAMGSRPLVGTELLQGFNLSVDFEEDGQLTLTPL
jgi:clan AA aspartic protease